jgi:hypothetical protein
VPRNDNTSYNPSMVEYVNRRIKFRKFGVLPFRLVQKATKPQKTSTQRMFSGPSGAVVIVFGAREKEEDVRAAETLGICMVLTKAGSGARRESDKKR